MIKKLVIGAGAVAASFIVAGGAVFAQSPSLRPSPSPTTVTTVPSAAPATGFGSN